MSAKHQSAAAHQQQPQVVLRDADTFMGAATLISCDGPDTQVQLPDGREVAVTLALAFTCVPQVGDTLAVIGREGHWYAIGIIHSQGTLHVQFHGDVQLQTEGRLELIGQQGVELRGDKVTLHAKTLKVAADSIIEKADTLYQRIKGLATLRSAKKQEVVTGQHSIRAERAQLTTRDAVRINGREIHLG